MPEVQDFIRLSLVSKRQDIISFTEAMCSDEFKLTVASDFSDISFTDANIILIDSSLFADLDLDILQYVNKISDISLCILPADLSVQAVTYVEKTFEYIVTYPINQDYFQSYCKRISKVLAKIRRTFTVKAMQSSSVPDSFSGYFCGDSCLIRRVRGQILQAAYSNEPVLILGETGTGKTTAAQVIHNLSDRKNNKMVSVSLSTIVESLAESTFFGHKRGSYTNAEYECCGYFEQANGSTLFLDELGIASRSLQAMLLTVLEDGNFKKIGDNKEQHVDVRMIFATNEDIEQMLRTGRLRRDLYFRIFDNLICIPPLRSHREDIPDMIMRYLNNDITISDDAVELLTNYNWPGNIRELHKCLRRACANCPDKRITADSIDFGDINFPQ